MKHIITFMLLLLATQLCAQENFPRIEKVIVKDKLYHGQIDKYPITIYLKFNQYANYHAGVYSVEGWYYYDNIKTKIPLVGLYAYPELILYNFKNRTKSNELLKFSEMKKNHWEDMEYYKNLEGYNEKFILSDSVNYWMNDDKKLEVSLRQGDLAIQRVQEFLLLDSTVAFDLHNFGSWTWNFELVAHQKGKFILQYEHGSRLYVMGQCGAGLEKGFFQLEFDKENNLIQYEEFVSESCNGSISTEEQEEESGQVTIYHCYDYSDEKSYDLTVDLGKVTIEKKEKN